MKRNFNSMRGLRAVVAASAVTVGFNAFFTEDANAAPAFSSSSSVKIMHDPDITASTTNNTKNVNPPPSSGSMVAYQYDKTMTYAGATTEGVATIGQYTTSTCVGFALGSGVG